MTEYWHQLRAPGAGIASEKAAKLELRKRNSSFPRKVIDMIAMQVFYFIGWGLFYIWRKIWHHILLQYKKGSRCGFFALVVRVLSQTQSSNQQPLFSGYKLDRYSV